MLGVWEVRSPVWDRLRVSAAVTGHLQLQLSRCEDISMRTSVVALPLLGMSISQVTTLMSASSSPHFDSNTMRRDDIDISSQPWSAWAPSLLGLSSGSSIICSGPSWTFSGDNEMFCFDTMTPGPSPDSHPIGVEHSKMFWASTRNIFVGSNFVLNFTLRQFKYLTSLCFCLQADHKWSKKRIFRAEHHQLAEVRGERRALPVWLREGREEHGETLLWRPGTVQSK